MYWILLFFYYCFIFNTVFSTYSFYYKLGFQLRQNSTLRKFIVNLGYTSRSGWPTANFSFILYIIKIKFYGLIKLLFIKFFAKTKDFSLAIEFPPMFTPRLTQNKKPIF